MLKLADLTIRRQGTVDWRVVPGSTHCGPAGAVKKKVEQTGAIATGLRSETVHYLVVKYEVRLTCAPKLDTRGFLIDQVNVDAFVQRFANTPRSLSCEEGCRQLAAAIIAKAQKDAPHCNIKELWLTLSPEPHMADITAHFSL